MQKTLRELREERGWTQAQLASMIDVAPSTVFNWEAGKFDPRLSQARDLAALFEVKLDDLVFPAEENPKKLVA